MLVKTVLVFWFWVAPLLGLLAGWPGLGLVLLVDLFLAWQVGGVTGGLAAMALLGGAALSFSILLGRKYGLGRELVAAAGLGFVLGLVTRPAIGLAGTGLLPALLLLRRSRTRLFLAFLSPLIRLLTALAFGLWLLIMAW